MEKEIERLIENRFFEGCPLRSGSEGMEGFARLTALFRSCSNVSFERHILRIEELIPKVDECVGCRIKLRIFLSIFCVDRLPEKAEHYKKEALEMQKNHRGDSDYFQEVNDAIKQFSGSDGH